jgi:hypothetical protein
MARDLAWILPNNSFDPSRVTSETYHTAAQIRERRVQWRSVDFGVVDILAALPADRSEAREMIRERVRRNDASFRLIADGPGPRVSNAKYQLLLGPAFGGIIWDDRTDAHRGALSKILFEKRLARLGLQGDYVTECIKWPGNE